MNFKKFLTALSVAALTCANASAHCALGTFFSSDDDINLQFYRSDNLLSMDRLDINSVLAGRDPSIRYHNGAFYICLVEPAESGQTFKILQSTDLIDWKAASFKVIDRGDKYPAVWAPDLFIDDDGAAYVYFSKQKGFNSKGGERTFDIYVSKADDIENPTFDRAQKISFDGYDNVIDAHVHKIDGQYYMVVKDEKYRTNNDNKSPALFRSDNPINNFVEIKNWALNAVRGCEGFSMASMDDQVFIYADNYSGKYDAEPISHHTVWITKDIENGPFRAEYVESNRPMRHGSVIFIDDPTVEKMIADFPIEPANVDIPSKTITIEREDYGTGKGHEIEIDKFAPAPDVIYRVSKKDRVTVRNLMNAYGVDKIEFELEEGAYIYIENVLKHENNSKRTMKVILRQEQNGWKPARE